MATIMKALGKDTGITIMEALGGKRGQKIANVIEENDLAPDPEPTVTYTVTYNVNGGTGSVEAAEVEAGESVTLDDGSGLTAPEGKEFSGWGLTDDATEAVASPFTPEADTTLYAIWADEEVTETPEETPGE